MLQFTDNEEARASSLMLKQRTLCDGKQTGFQCKHYWATVQLVDTQNPDALRSGDKNRYCKLASQFNAHPLAHLGIGGCEMAVVCTEYVRSSRRHDAKFELFNPMSQAEINALSTDAPRAAPSVGRRLLALFRGTPPEVSPLKVADDARRLTAVREQVSSEVATLKDQIEAQKKAESELVAQKHFLVGVANEHKAEAEKAKAALAKLLAEQTPNALEKLQAAMQAPGTAVLDNLPPIPVSPSEPPAPKETP